MIVDIFFPLSAVLCAGNTWGSFFFVGYSFLRSPVDALKARLYSPCISGNIPCSRLTDVFALDSFTARSKPGLTNCSKSDCGRSKMSARSSGEPPTLE